MEASVRTHVPWPPLGVRGQPSVVSATTGQSACVLKDCKETPRWSAGRWSALETRTVSPARVVFKDLVSTCVRNQMPVESMPSVKSLDTGRSAPVLSTSLVIPMMNVSQIRMSVC